jgi:hypothetical protein
MLTSLVGKEVSYAYESQSNIAWYFAGCKFPGKTTMLWITDTYRVVCCLEEHWRSGKLASEIVKSVVHIVMESV